MPRACCEAPPTPPLLTAAQAALVGNLRAVVGADHVRTSNIAPFTVGARMGNGEALAVVQPGTLQQAVDVLQACVDADVAVVPQGANTGELRLPYMPSSPLTAANAEAEADAAERQTCERGWVPVSACVSLGPVTHYLYAS